MDKKTFLSGILGQQPTPKQQTIGNLIGGMLLGGGLIGALNNAKVDTFGKANKNILPEMEKFIPEFDKRAARAQTGLVAELAGYENRAVEQAQTGLGARGITDRGVAKETKAQVKGGLSGAYAAARAALTGAKMRAGNALSSTMSQYYQDLAKKQYQAKLGEYYGKMGIWGALGGLGSSLVSASPIGQPKEKEAKGTKGTDNRVNSNNPKLNLGGF